MQNSDLRVYTVHLAVEYKLKHQFWCFQMKLGFERILDLKLNNLQTDILTN